MISSESTNNGLTPFEPLAACLLDKLIFRNEAQVKAMILQLLQRTLSDAMAKPNEFGRDWQEVFCHIGNDPKVRIVPVIRDTDSPAKSGPLLARQFRRLGGLADRWMIWPWMIDEAVKDGNALLFIDDFLGSGDQFNRFAERFKLEKVVGAKVVYAPLIAHPQGIAAIRAKYSNVQVVAGETLNETASVLPANDDLFDDHNPHSAARAQYVTYWANRNLTLPKNRLYGWENLNLALGFDHGTPNATLPLFWLSKPPHKPLLDR